ncbi:MAG TPA: hypothetical protein PKD45_01070 [Flavobacteriales bacterium]|nr:hypothetical protein [Flavobacteriales bacterium]
MQRYTFLFLAALLLPHLAHGQSDLPPAAPGVDLYLYGTIKSYETRDSLPGASVRLLEQPAGQELLHLVANERGRYELELNRSGLFRLAFSDEGRVAKMVEIDLRDVPDSLWAGGVAMNIEMTLFETLPGVDYSILAEPMGRARYNAELDNIAWDLEYTEGIRQQLKALQEAHSR